MTSATIHQALQAAIEAPGTVTKAQLVALLKKHPAPEAPAAEDLVIRDGILSVDLRECTCAASSLGAPEGCGHEHHCSLEPLLDISMALERAGLRG